MKETLQERLVDMALEVEHLQLAVQRARTQARVLTALGFISGVVCGLLLAGMMPN